MSTDARTFRQPGPVTLGWVAVVASLVVGVTSSSRLGVTFTGAMLLVAALAFVLLVRPSLQLSAAGVHVNNPVRRTVIPWALVEDCLARWNLQVCAGEDVVTVWALSAQVERPRRPGLYGAALGRRAGEGSWRAGEARRGTGMPSDPSAAAVGRLVEQGQAEWKAGVASGTLAADDGGRVVVRSWNLLDVALLVAPCLVVVAGVVTLR